MNLSEFKTKYPDIAAALIKEGETAGFDRGFFAGESAGMEKGQKESQESAKTAGATAERERIRAVREQLIPGHEGLIETLMFDGKTSESEAAVKVLAAEKQLRQDVLTQHRSDSPPAVPDPSMDSNTQMGKESDLPVEERAKVEWDKTPTIRKEFNGDYEAFLAGEKAMAAGKVKILGKKGK